MVQSPKDTKKKMWASSEDNQTYNTNNIASKTIKRCDAIEEESDSEKSPLMPLINEVR